MQHDSASASATASASAQPVVGIDVSQKTLDIFIDQLNQRFSIDNSDQAIAALVDEATPPDVKRARAKP